MVQGTTPEISDSPKLAKCETGSETIQFQPMLRLPWGLIRRYRPLGPILDERPFPSLNEPLAAADRNARIGLAFGLLAYALWGVLPVYFKSLTGVPAIDIVAHRIVWSLLFLAVLVAVTRGWSQISEGLRDRRTLRLLLITSALIAINWLLYVYAVTSGHILAGSLGYYLNPLMNIMLGRFILKERLTKVQWAAVAIAAAGVSGLAWGAGTTLWISLTLCVTFATYGLLRKIVSIDAIAGLAIETAILFPLSLGWLLWGLAAGQPSFGSGETQMWLLAAAGVVSTTPLLLFTAAARRLRYSTARHPPVHRPDAPVHRRGGLYDEAFTTAHAIAFGAIWTALALYVASPDPFDAQRLAASGIVALADEPPRRALLVLTGCQTAAADTPVSSDDPVPPPRSLSSRPPIARSSIRAIGRPDRRHARDQ